MEELENKKIKPMNPIDSKPTKDSSEWITNTPVDKDLVAQVLYQYYKIHEDGRLPRKTYYSMLNEIRNGILTPEKIKFVVENYNLVRNDEILKPIFSSPKRFFSEFIVVYTRTVYLLEENEKERKKTEKHILESMDISYVVNAYNSAKGMLEGREDYFKDPDKSYEFMLRVSPAWAILLVLIHEHKKYVLDLLFQNEDIYEKLKYEMINYKHVFRIIRDDLNLYDLSVKMNISIDEE